MAGASVVVNAIVVVLAGTYLLLSVKSAESITSAITLDRLNLFFLTLGFALHRLPRGSCRPSGMPCHPPGG